MLCSNGDEFAASLMAFFNRSFIVLWQGQLVSQLGNQAFLIASALFTLEHTGSTTLVGAVMIASTIPVVVLGPFGGTFADRHSRRAILIATDLLRAGAVGGLALILLSRQDLTTSHIALLVVVAAFNGIMAALFTPAVQAIIPDLVRDDRLASANAVSQFSNQAAILIGQAIGGLLYLRWGPAGLLLFDAISFAYAALATGFIPADAPPRRQTVRLSHSMRRYMVETREGIAYVRQRRGMGTILVTFAGVNFLFMPVFVLLPLYVQTVLGAGVEWYGFLLAGSGAGALCGALASVLVTRGRSNATVLGVCVAGIGCCVLALAAASAPRMALAAFVAIGVFSSVINVTVMTRFHAAVPREVKGRVMALVVVSSTAAVPLGMALGGVMGDLWRGSLAAVFALCGGAIAMLAGVAVRVPEFSGDRSGPGRRTS
jgi:DHA3 family macrolide efflux protein-like MFS transporter